MANKKRGDRKKKRGGREEGPKEYSLHVVGLLLHTAAQIVLTPPAPRNGGPFLPFFGQAGQVDPLVGWRCCY